MAMSGDRGCRFPCKFWYKAGEPCKLACRCCFVREEMRSVILRSSAFRVQADAQCG